MLCVVKYRICLHVVVLVKHGDFTFPYILSCVDSLSLHHPHLLEEKCVLFLNLYFCLFQLSGLVYQYLISRDCTVNFKPLFTVLTVSVLQPSLCFKIVFPHQNPFIFIVWKYLWLTYGNRVYHIPYLCYGARIAQCYRTGLWAG